MARGLSLVAGGAAFAHSERRISGTPAAGAQTGDALRARFASESLAAPARSKLPEPANPTLCEIFALHPRDGGWAGFILAQVTADKPLLWVQERMAILESGRIHPPGLPTHNLIHVETRDARDALWAMEEGVRCSCLSAVIGELRGDPRALDFTASRRLAVASERSGTPCWLVRLGGIANLSGARMRWRIASAPSHISELDPKAPGTPAWDAELFRGRGHSPGRWRVAHEGTPAGAFDLVAAPCDRALGDEQRLTA